MVAVQALKSALLLCASCRATPQSTTDHVNVYQDSFEQEYRVSIGDAYSSKYIVTSTHAEVYVLIYCMGGFSERRVFGNFRNDDGFQK